MAVWLSLSIALAILAYANALRNGFVFDDISIIVENPLVRSVDVSRIFQSSYWDRGGTVLGATDPTLYRPLTVLTYAVDFALWDLNPTAFHAVNVLLHAMVTAVLFLVAANVLGRSPAAFAAAAIFAVHPVHTEAVTGIVGRAEILATLFFLSAFWILRQPAAVGVGVSVARSIAYVLCGALLYLLGLFSKETAVTLPAILALDDWLRRDHLLSAGGSTRAMLPLRYLALIIAAAVYLAFRHQAVSGDAHIWPGFLDVSASARILTASRVAMEYIGLLIFPWTLLADYWKTQVPIATSVANPRVLLSILLWIGLAALVVRNLRRDAALVLAVAWFFITLAPVSNIVFPIGVAKAERLLYLPSVSVCLLAGWAYVRAESMALPRLIPRLALAAILAVFTLRTAVRNADWKDNLTLALATLDVSPASPLMNDIAAGELVKRGEPGRALPLLREAVRQAPDLPLLRSHLGATYYGLGQLDQAIIEYREAIRRNAADAEAHNNLGVAYLDTHRDAEAIAEFGAAISINPGYADPHMNLGVFYLDRQRLDEATRAFSAAVRANPSSADAHNGLGVAYARIGRLDSAAAHYREALRLNPSFTKARANLSALTERRTGGGAKP